MGGRRGTPGKKEKIIFSYFFIFLMFPFSISSPYKSLLADNMYSDFQVRMINSGVGKLGVPAGLSF